MKRLEIIANQSVREELIEEIETAMPDVEYTMIPIVHGKGRRKRKEGTRTWPETNFYLLVYLDEEGLAAAEAAVKDITRRFPDEGIYAAISDADPIVFDGATEP
jgi:hypothetical protein